MILYEILRFIPRHGFSEETLRESIITFLVTLSINNSLREKGIYIVSASNARVNRLLFGSYPIR